MRLFPILPVAGLLLCGALLALNGPLSHLGQNTPTTQNDMPDTGNGNHDPLWREIDSLNQMGLTQDALAKTEALYAILKRENDDPAQLIKAITYRSNFMSRVEEDGLVKAIARFEEETQTATFPAKAILLSMTAEMYDRYLEQNLWKFNDRTATDEDFKPGDVTTWDVPRFSKRIAELYGASLNYPQAKALPLANFQLLLNGFENNSEQRPTLYDFLAHRAIDFFMDDKYYLTKPAFEFVVEQPEVFASAEAFVAHSFVAKDSTSGKFRVLKLMQDLLRFRLSEQSIPALVDADLKRLKFAHSNSVLPDKEERFLAALEALQKKYADNPVSAEVIFEVASLYAAKGGDYTAENGGKNHPAKGMRKKAFDLCEDAIKKFSSSYGASQCRALQSQLLQKDLNLQLEKVYAINEPILMRVGYTNVNKVYFRMCAIGDKQKKEFQNLYGEKMLNYLLSLPAINTWEQALPTDSDYNPHAAEAAAPKMGASGYYLVMASEDPKFKYKGNGVAYSFFYVSNISFNDRGTKGNHEFLVTDRLTGKPIVGAVTELWSSRYNSRMRDYEYVLKGSVKTNAEGLALFPKTQGNDNSYRVKIINGKDILFLDNTFYSYNYNNYDPELQEVTHFFLDRAIYRPGQTIYFKGLVIKGKGKNWSVVTSGERTLELYDANWQKVSDLKLKLNEYGTYNGSFTAPTGGLTGQMSIVDVSNQDRHYFRVEEYKRPKFEVSFDPVKESYKLGDKVLAKGTAKAYAGSNIDGAKVQYRVTRSIYFPYWRWWDWGWYIPWRMEETQMSFGETVTDANGAFEIPFEALADKNIPREQKPNFIYTVYADVTDMAGETHSSSSTITVGYIALAADMVLPGSLSVADSFKTVNLSTQNLNGEFEPASGSIKIEKLKVPERIYRKRYWGNCDMLTLTEEQYNRDFPNYAWNNKDKEESWPVESVIQTSNFATKYKDGTKETDAASLAVPVAKLNPGIYRITMDTRDKNGEQIKVVKQIRLYSPAAQAPPAGDALFFAPDKSSAEPGETVTVYIASAVKSANVYFEVEEDGKIVQHKWMQVKGSDKLVFPILERHRGNFSYHLTMVHDNRSYRFDESVLVPWSNKDLKLEYQTFRDKLYPGQKEEWRIKISGNKADKVAAEMVAAMYDASLDEFAANYWGFSYLPYAYSQLGMNSLSNFNSVGSSRTGEEWVPYYNASSRYYPYLNWYGFNFWEYGYYYRGGYANGKGAVYMDSEAAMAAPAPAAEAPGGDLKLEKPKAVLKSAKLEEKAQRLEADADGVADQVDDEPNKPSGGEKGKDGGFGEVKVRTNLNETVFFFPNMTTDADGSITIKFTMNEALTRWKFMTFAHTKDLQYGMGTRTVVTQKDLMVTPNAPRFMREGDDITFSAKVSNLTDKEMTGEAVLQLFDAVTDQPADVAFGNSVAVVPFTAKGGQSAAMTWTLKVPLGWLNPLKYRVIARSGDFSDGEENVLPVVTNRMLVTETMPLPVRGGQTKTFDFARMREAGASPTLQNHRFTLEFTSNPAWYAVQALPYLMEYPYECTEQIFSRFYANALASTVANSHPKVRQVFDQWKGDANALKSNLAKNEELKYALLEETPWVLQSQDEEQQKRNVGLLFDLNKMSNELGKAVDKMADRQLGNGGFAWFSGGPDDHYITQYIMEGVGHMDRLGVKVFKDYPKTRNMMENAVRYCDDRMVERYNRIRKEDLDKDNLGYMEIHYLYARSFYLNKGNEARMNIPLDGNAQKVYDYYLGLADKYWNNGKGSYMQGLISLAAHRNGKTVLAQNIVKALRQNAIMNEELGMYWKYVSGWFWFEMPIETQALMIEVFDEVANDAKAVEDLKLWLLKNKQTNDWRTTKATASACYALLLRGDNWLLEDKEVGIKFGQMMVDQSKIKKEAGTGYFKTAWEGKDIKQEWAKVEVSNPNKNPAWGAIYWQYFEQLDKITYFKDTPLKLDRKFFKQVNTDRGPQLIPLGDKAELVVGDLVKVRCELRVDRDMEYVHLKDARAAGFEPVNVLSGYRWQGGLGYYESTRDMSTNFFIGYLPKGSYVFEYPLRVTHKGDFSTGVTTIQCMYAPEFTSHSEGGRVIVK